MRYFITYGDSKYSESKERILEQASKTGVFDKVIGYDKRNLSLDILESEAMDHDKGGGYWIWKPFIILKTLQEMKNGDILVYADAGCTINISAEWQCYFDELYNVNGLFFLLNTTVRQYTRPDVIELFSANGKFWDRNYQVSATCVILKKDDKTIKFITEWNNFMIENFFYVKDLEIDKLLVKNKKFIAHRHDQSILTALFYEHRKRYNFKYILNHFEGGQDLLRSQAIVATRISDENSRKSISF